jgi:ribulose-5-phosphate 4-epimerase/fuculose-1-phosphate aldolase
MRHPPSGGPVDRAVLEDLAAANRILADKGIFDSAGHVSMRHPQAPERFLISRSIAPALVTPDDIMEHDLDCLPCEDRGRSSFLERFIHGEIYRARPDVTAVVHSHSASVIPFGLTQTPLRATYHNASFLAAGVPVFDIRQKFGATDQVISDAARAVALAETLGDKAVALLRAHGMVVGAPDLPSAVFRAIVTEASARIQQNAIALGGPIEYLDEEEGRLGDAVNLATVNRPWELWRRSVSF